MKLWRHRHRVGLWVAASFVLLATWLQPRFAELHSPNPLVRVYLTRAMVDDGSLSIDGPIQRYGNLGDKSRRDGRYYCDKAPGLSLAALPIYAAWRLLRPAAAIDNQDLLSVLRFFWVALPVALVLLFLDTWLAALAVSARNRAAALAALAGGSLLLPYSLEMFGHAPVACLIFFCAHALFARAPASSAPGWRVVWAGLWAGLAVLVEYPALFLVVTLLLVAWLSRPQRLRFALAVAAGGTLPALVFMLYHHAAFGGPLTTGYAFIDNAYFHKIHEQGFMGLSWPQPEALVASLFSPARGVVFAAPWLALAPLGFGALWRRQRPLALALIACAAIYVLFVSSFRYWIGGWALGQRHLTPLMPLAALGFGVWLQAVHEGESRRQRLARLLGASAAAIAVVQIVAACVTLPTFAEEYANPFYEQTWRLLRLGLFGHSLGTFWGLSSRVAALLPLLIAVAWVALCLRAAAPAASAGLVDGWLRARAAVGVALWLALMPLVEQGTAKSEHRFEWIVDTVWEPRDHLPAKLPDPVKTLPGLSTRRSTSSAMLRHLARHLAAQGKTTRALELLSQARLKELRKP